MKPVRALFLLWALGLVLHGCGPSGSPEGSDPDGTGGAASRREVGTCGRDSGTVLSGSGVGALRIGRTVAEVRQACDGLVDSVIPMGLEGMPQRILFVGFGPDTVEAEVVDDRIWRLSIGTPRIRTSDSLGVGSTLAELLRTPDVAPALGEGALFVISPSHCGVSFDLGAIPDAMSDATFEAMPGSASGDAAAAPRSLADTIRVKRVLVSGCSR